jgi:large-conductance mechanosensitive channel
MDDGGCRHLCPLNGSSARRHGRGHRCQGEAAITYGNFLQATIDFLIIISFALFLFVKAVNRARSAHKEPEIKNRQPHRDGAPRRDLKES